MCDPTKPTVSFVVPCYDQGAYLDDVVSSCVESYDGPAQVIVVDDGSSDPMTRRYIEDLAQHPVHRLEVVRQENGGLSRARNVGIARATGEFVQLVDADDLLVRNKVTHQLRHFAFVPELDVSICDYQTCDGSRTDFAATQSSITSFDFTVDNLLYKWERGLSIPIHTAIFRRGVFAGRKPFAEGQRAKEDWIFWVGLGLAGTRVGYLPLRLAIYRLHGSNMTRSWAAMGLEWIKAARLIESRLDGRYPDFMDRSLRWYREFYLARACSSARAATRSVAAPAPEALPEQPARVAASVDAAASSSDVAAISVVVPVFNHARHLAECVRSAHEQTRPPREIVCVDDGSTDPAVREILDRLAAEIPELETVYLGRNRGISCAQNEAVRIARGDFVAFLDCDDRLHPNALAAVATAIAEHPEADYFFTDRFDIDEHGRVLRRAEYGGYPSHFEFDRVTHHENLLHGMVASHLKVVRRASVLDSGGFDPALSGVQDWDLALKVATPTNLRYLPSPLYYHRIHVGSVTLGQRARMFRLTNEVRRRHQGIRERRDAARVPEARQLLGVFDLVAGEPVEGQARGGFRWCPELQAWRNERSGTLVVRRRRAFRTAFEQWRHSDSVVFALAPGASSADLAFLREFNSYYDLVLCATEAQWATLHRYMWDARALRLVDELPGEPSADPLAITTGNADNACG